MSKRKKKPEDWLCGNCSNHLYIGEGETICHNSDSPKFLEETTNFEGCGYWDYADWLEDESDE